MVVSLGVLPEDNERSIFSFSGQSLSCLSQGIVKDKKQCRKYRKENILDVKAGRVQESRKEERLRSRRAYGGRFIFRLLLLLGDEEEAVDSVFSTLFLFFCCVLPSHFCSHFLH